jgi:tetratricopeptide (TPR) repeat protein
LRGSANKVAFRAGLTARRIDIRAPSAFHVAWRGFLAAGLLVAFFAASAQPQSAPASDFESYLAQGVALQRKGDMQGAKQIYQRALKIYPDRVELAANLGQVLLRLGEYDGAVVYLSKAAAAAAGNAALRFSLGLAKFRSGQPASAAEEFRRILAHNPNHADANRLLGYCLLQMDQLDEAVTVLEGAYQAQPSNIDTAYTLASAYLKANRLEPLRALIDGPVGNTESAPSYFIRGAYEAASKNYTQAFADLERARQLDPKLAGLHSQLAYTHVLVGDYDEAIQLFEAALSVDPSDFNANAFLGWLYRERGEAPRAARSLERARKFKPGDAGVLFQLGLIHHAAGEPEQARVLLEKVVAAEQELTEAHVVLAQIYFAQKRFADAQRERKVVARLHAKEQDQQPRGEELRYNGLAVPKLK